MRRQVGTARVASETPWSTRIQTKRTQNYQNEHLFAKLLPLRGGILIIHDIIKSDFYYAIHEQHVVRTKNKDAFK